MQGGVNGRIANGHSAISSQVPSGKQSLNPGHNINSNELIMSGGHGTPKPPKSNNFTGKAPNQPQPQGNQ